METGDPLRDLLALMMRSRSSRRWKRTMVMALAFAGPFLAVCSGSPTSELWRTGSGCAASMASVVRGGSGHPSGDESLLFRNSTTASLQFLPAGTSRPRMRMCDLLLYCSSLLYSASCFSTRSSSAAMVFCRARIRVLCARSSFSVLAATASFTSSLTSSMV